MKLWQDKKVQQLRLLENLVKEQNVVKIVQDQEIQEHLTLKIQKVVIN